MRKINLNFMRFHNHVRNRVFHNFNKKFVDIKFNMVQNRKKNILKYKGIVCTLIEICYIIWRTFKNVEECSFVNNLMHLFYYYL